MRSAKPVQAAQNRKARDGALLSLSSLSRKDLTLLEAAARNDGLTLHAFLLERIETYARFLASREALRRRAVERTDPVFTTAYKALVERGERPTAHRLAQMTKKQHRAAQRWLQFRHPRLRTP